MSDQRPTDLLPDGQVGELVHIAGWLYILTDEGSLEALDSRDARYIPTLDEYDDAP